MWSFTFYNRVQGKRHFSSFSRHRRALGVPVCTHRVCWRCLVSPFLSSLSLECQKQLVLSAQEVLPLLSGLVSAEWCLVEGSSRPHQGREMGHHRDSGESHNAFVIWLFVFLSFRHFTSLMMNQFLSGLSCPVS